MNRHGHECACEPEKTACSFLSLITLPAVDEKHAGDDDDEECFELEEVLQVEAPGFVARYGVKKERAAYEADRQPDDLPLPIPHIIQLV
jgi:hypothetical protein